MVAQVNLWMGMVCALVLWHQENSSYNRSFVLFKKPSVQELSGKIVHAGRQEMLVRSNQWRTVATWWHELVRILAPAVRLRLHRYIDAGNMICFDVSWIREHCLLESSVIQAAHLYRDHKIYEARSACAYAYGAAQVCCLHRSVIMMAVRGDHKEISRVYFEHPGRDDLEESEGDVFYVKQAYYALWNRVSQELEVIDAACAAVMSQKGGVVI